LQFFNLIAASLVSCELFNYVSEETQNASFQAGKLKHFLDFLPFSISLLHWGRYTLSPNPTN